MSGQALLPAAAMFEAATAAVAHLGAASSTTSSFRGILAALSIAAPLALSPRGEAMLELSISPAAGSLAAYSLNVVSADRQLHLRARAAQCLPQSGSAASVMSAANVDSQQLQRSSRSSGWAAVVLREAVATLGRFAGGTLALLDTAQEQPGGGYHCHPAAADGCLQTGVLFTATSPASDDSHVGAAATGRVPVAVAAYAAAQQPPEAAKWAGMGAAVLQPNGAALSDYTLAAGGATPAGASATNVALSQMLAKPVAGSSTSAQGAAAGAGHDMVYAVEWRAYGIGLGEGSLSMPLKADTPAAELAIARPHAQRRRLLPPVSRRLLAAGRHTSTSSTSTASSAFNTSGGMAEAARAMRLGGGVLALLQSALAAAPAAGERLQLNLHGGAGGIAGAPRAAGSELACAGAAAILKVIQHCDFYVALRLAAPLQLISSQKKFAAH